MFLTTKTYESITEFLFDNPMFIYCIIGVLIALFSLYSGKNPKLKPIAMILYAIYFISFLIIVRPF